MPQVFQKRQFLRWPLAAAALLALAGAHAQDDESAADEPAADDETVDEIVVIGGRPGDPVDVQAKYDELLRSRLQKDLDRMRVLEEEYEWRRSDARVENPSRIRWGYDAKADLKMRRDTSLTDLPFEKTKPATIFTIEF